MFDSPIETDQLVKQIANLKQLYTQVGGARPFGVSLMFIGTNGEPQLFVTDPTGIFFEYMATAIGEAENEVKDILNKEYRENMNLQDGLKLAFSALKRVLGKDFSVDRVDGATIRDGKFQRLTRDDLQKVK